MPGDFMPDLALVGNEDESSIKSQVCSSAMLKSSQSSNWAIHSTKCPLQRKVPFAHAAHYLIQMIHL